MQETRSGRGCVVSVLLGIARALGVVLIFALVTFLVSTAYWTFSGQTRPIPSDFFYHFAPQFVGAPAQAQPLDPWPVAQNPYMAATVSNNMHNDSHMTDTYPVSGPLGVNPRQMSRAFGAIGGMCPSPNFDSQGRIIVVCVDFGVQQLHLLDPVTLETLAEYPIPVRPVNASGDLDAISSDTSGGAYFYVDHEDRAVVAASDLTIKVIGLNESGPAPIFELEAEYDLTEAATLPDGRVDVVTTTMPDWDGNYWFVTRLGVVGVVDRDTGAIETLYLEGEEFQNSFAVGEDGVYIVSDYALYRFEADPDTGEIVVVWREEYDRGERRKPGMINQGSGTTPTLLDDDLVVIADNAEPRMHVLFYHRASEIDGPREICRVPVFPEGRSATENTVIGYRDSVIVENNYGRDVFSRMLFGRTGEPGFARIDVNAERTDCQLVWENTVENGMAPVPKLSIANGLIYTHTKTVGIAPIDAWYFTAIDFRTGETVYKTLTGTGMLHDNNGGPVTLGPDGTAYMSVLNGIIRISDSDTPYGVGDFLSDRLPLLIIGGLALLLTFLIVRVIDVARGRARRESL